MSISEKEFVDMYRIEEIERANTGNINDLLDEMWSMGWRAISVVPRGRSGIMAVFINYRLEQETYTNEFMATKS